ncbi:MAG TPA: cupin domain-containing protein [Dysgonamonadaceae bacterium]|nr:cupin domain-containing protein [Dysgonamonadaceae bacterium]
MRKKIIHLMTLAFVGLFAASCTQSAEQPKEEPTPVEAKSLNLEFRDFGNDPFVFNIEDYTKANKTYRTALWTGEYMQLTVMNILPGEDIGLEIHTDHDQFIRVEEGEGIVMMGDAEDNLTFQERVEDDFAIMIPAGKWHNVVNDSNKPLKLYSIYAPREHEKNTVHQTKEEALADEHDH